MVDTVKIRRHRRRCGCDLQKGEHAPDPPRCGRRQRPAVTTVAGASPGSLPVSLGPMVELGTGRLVAHPSR